MPQPPSPLPRSRLRERAEKKKPRCNGQRGFGCRGMCVPKVCAYLWRVNRSELVTQRQLVCRDIFAAKRAHTTEETVAARKHLRIGIVVNLCDSHVNVGAL